jgi:hypothetical protein
MRNFMMSGSTHRSTTRTRAPARVAAETDAAAAAAQLPPQPPRPPKPWYEGADAELIGHIQTKGWHDKPANEAALAAIQAHREAEKFIGAPADRIIKLPATPDEAGLGRCLRPAGRSQDRPREYDFSSVKVGDEPARPGRLVEFFRTQAAALHLPKDAAPALLHAYLKHQNGIGAPAAAEKTAKLAEEHKVLDANWGANAEANKFLARKGAEKLGLDAAAVDALEGVVGYAKTMEALRKVGEISGEAKFIGGNGMTQGRHHDPRAGGCPQGRADGGHEPGRSATWTAARPRAEK